MKLNLILFSNYRYIPEVSPTGRYTTLVPPIFILSVPALKDIVEDIVPPYKNFPNLLVVFVRIVPRMKVIFVRVDS